MPFQPVQPEKLSHSVTRQIEQLILRGILRPGERLPSERELSDKLAVSRPSLREAIADLQARGLLDSRAGSGIYISESLGTNFPKALSNLFATHDEAVFDYLSFRRDLEALAGERAALLGSDTDLKVIDTIFQKMASPTANRKAQEDADLDAQFHLSIIEASHNIIMLHMMRSMYDLLRQGVFYNRTVIFNQHTTRDALLDQHRAINSAIQSRDAPAARKAIEAHMDFIGQSLRDQITTSQNEEIARQRLAHEQARG